MLTAFLPFVSSFLMVSDSGFDIVTRIRSWFPSPVVVGMDFVDIDDATFAAWGQSGVTDRAKLRRVIELAVNDEVARSKDAKLHRDKLLAIIVDLDLASNPTLDAAANSDALRAYLREYSEDYPPIILARSLHQAPGQAAGAANLSALTPSPTIFGDTAPQYRSHGAVYFGSSGFLRSLDGVVRSWRLAEPMCDPPGIVTASPSIELLAVAAANAQIKELLTYLASSFDGKCELVTNMATTGFMAESTSGKASIFITPNQLHRDKILFSIPWRPPLLVSPTQRAGSADGRGYVGYWNGLTYIDRPLPEPDDKANLRVERRNGHILMIGGSNDQSRDTWLTPLGMMPGAMIVLNAIDSLQRQGELREFSFLTEFGLSIFIGMCFWFFLHLLADHLGPVVALIFGVIGVALSLVFLNSGIWFDPLAMVAGIIAHFATEWLTSFRSYLREKGLRGLIQPRFESNRGE